MTPGAHLRTLVFNEARALAPTWLACVLAATVAVPADGTIHAFSLFAFAAGMIALGAQSIGHDQTHRTLGLVLTLPVSRPRLFVVKLSVVLAMVLPLAAYAHLLGHFRGWPALPWLIAAGALCLAPVLTMLCRSGLAGTVFTGSIPGVLLNVVMLVSGTGWSAPEADERAAFAITTVLMLPVLAVSGLLGWRQFMRLEAIEGEVAEIHLRWRTRPVRPTGRRQPLWQLVKKEIRLQQMSFAITALYVAWAAAISLTRIRLDIDDSVIAAASAIYWLALPVVIGSQASAEERQLGTLPWQQLLPAPAWRQGAAKVATVLLLALVLGMVVPALIVPLVARVERPIPVFVFHLTVVMTAASLYVSSLCATRVRAAVLACVVIPTALWLVVAFARTILRVPFEPRFWDGQEGPWFGFVCLVVAVLVRFAFVNHRPEPPAPARIWRQSLSIAAVVGFGLIVLEAGPC